MMSSQQGSFNALSLLAANPQTALIGAAVVGGVAITVAGATFIYKEFKEYIEKQHLNDIKSINKLHEQHLSKIFVPGRHETLSLPIIFQMKSENDLTSIQSLRFNDDEVKAIANRLPRGQDIALAPYQEAIRNAILKLKEYYFSRTERNDTTACVIAYLLEMLDSHCLKFEGYDYDIAYLHAIASFINAYASRDQRENTKKFSHLDEVYSHLITAHHYLDLHKDMLSLQEIIGDLYDSCRYLSDQSLTYFAMIINPIETWSNLETVTKNELANGMLKKYFVRTDLLKGLITIPDNEINVLPSPFKNTLINLTKYALMAINPDKVLNITDIPEVDIPLPDLMRFNYLKQKTDLTIAEKQERRKLKEEFEELKLVFYKCRNFLTTELDHKQNQVRHKFISIVDYDELLNRVRIMREFAEMIREIISLQYYSLNLIKGIKLLGEIDVTSMHHIKVFNVMDELCEKIQNDFLTLKKDLYKIQEENNAMQLRPTIAHRDKIYELLETTNSTIGVARNAINAYWNKNRKVSKERKLIAENNLFEAADLIGKVHALPFTLPSDISSELRKYEADKENIDRLSEHPDKLEIVGLPDVSGEVGNNTVLPENVNSQQPNTSVMENINKILTEIKNRITDINKIEKPATEDINGRKYFNNEIDSYLAFSGSLDSFYEKIMTITNEENKNEQRNAKVEHLLSILQSIANHYLAFIYLKRNDRFAKVVQFNQQVQQELSNQAHAIYIDAHKTDFFKTVNSLMGDGFFKTDSRSKLLKLSLACTHLTRVVSGELDKEECEENCVDFEW